MANKNGKETNNRRAFLKMAAVSGIGIGMSGPVPPLFMQPVKSGLQDMFAPNGQKSAAFAPRRAASWWVTIDDIMWPEKDVIDRIKRRAAAFAEAEVDTAINFGFHIRFDFADYFHRLHGYYRNVCEALHPYNIRFLDHYSCNHIERPRGASERRKLHRNQRHHVLLYPDEQAARHAQYEGVLFDDICELDMVDGSRGYTDRYQMEVFCPNNPRFLEMHRKYLLRLLDEVPLDGMEIDDMCDYAGLRTCGCPYCRARLKKDYGREIPPFGDKSFWGKTDNKNSFSWGNYENPAFKDWLRMKSDSFVDHLKMIQGVIGERPLMTCVSSSGPIILNGLSLNVERMAPQLNFFMLENVGINTRSVNWVPMDAEALNQKDIARNSGNAPALALSYTIYEKGGYLGWSLARFWGVANWASTLNGRLVADPPEAMEIEDIVGPFNRWEREESPLDFRDSKDFVEVRLVSSLLCRENGWRNKKGREQWDSVKAWSAELVKNNIGYRILRSEELADAEALPKDHTPLILDNLGCVSDDQWQAIKQYLEGGGAAWVVLPFGVKDGTGRGRKNPLHNELKKMKAPNLRLLSTTTAADMLKKLLANGLFKPAVTQLAGDRRWALRVRYYNNKPVLHFLNTALQAVAHPTLKDISGTPVLNDIRSASTDNHLRFAVDRQLLPLGDLVLKSPEWKTEQRQLAVEEVNDSIVHIDVPLDHTILYAVAE